MFNTTIIGGIVSENAVNQVKEFYVDNIKKKNSLTPMFKKSSYFNTVCLKGRVYKFSGFSSFDWSFDKY